MATGTTVNIPIQAHDQFTLVFNRAQAGLAKFAGSFTAVRAGWAAVAAVALGAGSAMTKAASESQQAGNRLNAVLKATGYSAGITRTEINGLVDDLTALSQFDDEAIAGGAAELLKFGNITKDVFGDALKAAVDFAAFTGETVPDAAQAVGKALSNPIEGLGMLEREIGKLTPAQEKMIKNLVESGRQGQAMAAVLDILKGKFGDTSKEMTNGYLQTQSRVSKAWNEFLEAGGKWGPVATTIQGGMNAVATSLEKVKTIIESGTWYEKWMLLTGNPMMMAGAMGLVSDPAKAGPSAEERRKAMQGDLDRQAKEQAAGQSEQDARVNKIIADGQEKAHKEYLEREKRLQDEGTRGWVAYADAVFDEAFQFYTDLAKIQDEHWAREEKLRQLDMKGWVEYADHVFDEAFEMYSELARIQDETNNKASKAARELGMVFSSAFEDAIVGGRKFREILQGIAQDILRLFIRKQVTEPAAGFFGELFKGFGGTGGSDGAGSAVVAAPGGGTVPALASGTPFVHSDGLAFLHRGEAVLTAAENRGGGGVTIVQHFNVQGGTPAAVRDQVMAMMPAMAQQARAAVRDERNRSGDRR